MSDQNQNIPTLLTVKQFSDSFPAFSSGALRNYIFFENTNGLAKNKVILRVGRKILIDVDRFFAWIDNLNNIGGNNEK